MLETAYVLPIVLGVILFVVETVAFAMNSFAANDVLTDVHTAIIADVQTVSNSADGAATGYAICEAGKVKLDVSKQSQLTEHVKTALEATGVEFVAGQPAQASISLSSVAGFDVYVIGFTGTANSLVLPEMLVQFLPMNVDTIVSIKDSCNS